jgi:hypothetical protein
MRDSSAIQKEAQKQQVKWNKIDKLHSHDTTNKKRIWRLECNTLDVRIKMSSS